MIRLADPDIDDNDVAAAVAVLRSGWLVQGATVSAFETELAGSMGVSHVVAVSSGTAALQLALTVAGIQPGKKVAVSAFSWPATANAVALCGAEPVFVDIDPDTFAMAPAMLRAAFDRHPDLAAVLPVHPFGLMADMPALCEVASAFGVPLVEDAACAIGAALDGRPAGAWGTLGCFSFHPRKIVATGEGGAVATNDKTLARRLRRLRNHGMEIGPDGPHFVEPGFNYRLTEFQAAIGRTQHARLQASLATRRALADEYARGLSGTGIRFQHVVSREAHVFQAFVVLVPPGLAMRRSALIGALRDNGIEAAIGTYHIPLTSYYRARGSHRHGDFPVTDDVARRSMAIPMHCRLSAAEQQTVIQALRALL